MRTTSLFKRILSPRGAYMPGMHGEYLSCVLVAVHQDLSSIHKDIQRLVKVLLTDLL